MDEAVLDRIYEAGSEKPGWFSKCAENLKLSTEDLAYLEWRDETDSAVREKLKAWNEQNRREGGIEIELLETPEEKISALSGKICSIAEQYIQERNDRMPWWIRELGLQLSDYDLLIRLRSRCLAMLWHTRNPEQAGRITDADIERARAYPMDQICEINRAKMTVCLWHDDKRPSMWVKGNFGYCFTCTAWADPIRYWMKKTGRSFVEAVEALGRL